MYTTTRNDLETFLFIDSLWDPETDLSVLLAGLHSDNWQVQQAALAAIGDRGKIEALPNIESLLDEQDHLDVYGAPDEWNLNAATDEEQKAIWRCRFRVKQAAMLALASCVDQYGAYILDDKLVERVQRYAIDQNEDYALRAVACGLLGRMRPSVQRLKTLRKATADGEWCTSTAAKKALSGEVVSHIYAASPNS